MKQFISFVRKEFYHIFRDARTTMILLLMPVILIILFGYAITTEIKRVPIAIFDQSRDELTLKMADRLNASEYFELYTTVDSYEDAGALFRQGKVHVIVVFPPGYASTADAQVQVLTPVTTLLYNPQMKGAYNFVPGVMGLILILICAMMTSIGIVKEKEMGTMEVLLVSPLKPIYIILAKAIPYLLLSMVNIATILLLSYFLLDVPIKGSLLLLVSVSILYAIVSLCLGLLISTVADTQQAAMLISGIALMLPIMLLSGMMFPIENMPDILQWFSHIVPAKWYIIAVKDVMIKGLPAVSILKEIGILSFMAVVLVFLSVKRFKIRL